MFQLTIRDATDEIDLLSLDYELVDGGFNVGKPESRDVWGGESVYVDGSALILSALGNRQSSIEFAVTGETRDILNHNVARLDRIIQRAKRKSIEEQGGPVELVYAWTDTVTSTHFEVLSGEIEWPEDVMGVEQVLQESEGRFRIKGFILSLTLSPLAYPVSLIYGDAENVQLSNGNGTGTSVTVNNANDTTKDNFVTISATQVQGAYPAFVTIKIKATTNDSEKTSKVYMGVRKGSMSFKSVLDDADSSFRIGSVGTTPSEACSGGTYSALTYAQTNPGTNPPIQEAVIIRWSLTDSEMESTRGPFRMFGRVRPTTYWDTNCNYAIRVSWNSVILSQTEWRSPLNTTTTLFDFGTVFLPPWLGTMQDLAGLDIEIVALRKSYGTTTIGLDYVALLPQDGGYRVLEFRGSGIAINEFLVDDGWKNSVYHENTSGKRAGVPFALMPPIRLIPHQDQRIYFLMEGTAGSSEITRDISVQVGVVPTFMVMS
jgi:hypothetical protein